MAKKEHETGIREKANLDVKNKQTVRRVTPTGGTSQNKKPAKNERKSGSGNTAENVRRDLNGRNDGKDGGAGRAIDPAETKKKVYLFCVGVALMVANFTIGIGNLNINILPGFVGCILFFPLAGYYCRESILARGVRIMSVPAAVYAAVVYFITLFRYSEVSSEWWGIGLSFFETSIDLILCYLFLLSLHNTGAFRKNDAQGTHTAMVWFWLMAVSAVGVYFCSGTMAVICRLIQCVAAVLYAVFGARGIMELDKEKGGRPGGKTMKYPGRK